jgi:hypothetical protein
MELKSKSKEAFRLIEHVGEGEATAAGERSIRPLVKASVLIGPKGSILSIRITPIALIISEPSGKYALPFDGEPETERLLESML